MNILKTGLFFIFVPLLLAVGLPLWFIRTTSPLFSFGILRWLAVLFWAVGWTFVLLSFWNFATRGQGTPNPLDPPRRLVVSGLNRYTRNPIYFGVITVMLGWIIWYPSLLILLMLPSALAVFLPFVLLYEEPHLRKVFGEEYIQYCREVPRWIPRWR